MLLLVVAAILSSVNGLFVNYGRTGATVVVECLVCSGRCGGVVEEQGWECGAGIFVKFENGEGERAVFVWGLLSGAVTFLARLPLAAGHRLENHQL